VTEVQSPIDVFALAASANLEGQVALVTGGGGAIGRAISESVAKAGGAVIVADMSAGAARTVAEAINTGGGRAVAKELDVSSARAVEDLAKDVAADFGRIDILVNCAGVFPVRPFADVTIEEWRQVFAVNLDGPFLTIKHFAPMMAGQQTHASTGTRGKILNVTSGAASVGRPLLASYGASKAALNHLTMTTAAVYGEHQISAIAIVPGQVLEGALRPALEAMAVFEGRDLEEMIDERRRGGISPPGDTGRLVTALAAVRGNELNGHLVSIDGTVSPLTLAR
jgi:NAD(P)-dependent dehydrogenase (short-subunit alcohol dehydrogenase family)